MASPHDALFKHVFSRPEHAAGELRHVLPPAVVRHVDWSSLRLLPGSFVDDDLRDQHADLLYSVRLAGRPALLYLLLEHKSAPDPWTPLQLLAYCVRLMERFRREHPQARKLPPVMAVVVHHSEQGWRGATELAGLFDMPPEVCGDLAPWLPNLRFLLDDLARESAAALQARTASALVRLALFCLQRARHSGDLLAELRPWRDAFRAVLGARDGAEALAAVLWYIIQVQGLAPDDVERFLRVEIGPETETAMKTTYEQLIDRGREEGRAEGQAGMLLKLLTSRFGELPAAVVERVRSASPDRLEQWALRFVRAQTLDEVFGAE